MNRRTLKKLRWEQVLQYVSRWGPVPEDDVYRIIYKITPGASRSEPIPVDIGLSTFKNDIRNMVNQGLLEVSSRNGVIMLSTTEKGRRLPPEKDFCG